ncbi:MAG: hypothetical protein E6J41_03215 [Chloroflexi bacterium]|nr:MAG: hypothetical protein E6J41_03215 [Chloroflexota bacterium]
MLRAPSRTGSTSQGGRGRPSIPSRVRAARRRLPSSGTRSPVHTTSSAASTRQPRRTREHARNHAVAAVRVADRSTRSARCGSPARMRQMAWARAARSRSTRDRGPRPAMAVAASAWCPRVTSCSISRWSPGSSIAAGRSNSRSIGRTLHPFERCSRPPGALPLP